MTLKRALLFTFVAHAAGMLTMALLLLPGVPGGATHDLADRAAYVAQHPWLWRVGWLGWQVTALSDLLLALALLRTPWVFKPAAWATLLLTVAGLLPDQFAQFRWTWPGVTLAEQAVRTDAFDAYHTFEADTFRLIAVWGTVGYLAAAVGWSVCFARAGVWSPRMTVLSVVTGALFAASTVLLVVPASLAHRQTLGVVGAGGNALAFVLLMIWLAAVTERVLRRSRPTTPFGRDARWQHPEPGLFARLCDGVANSRLARALFERLPAASMTSDITDVVYVNYLADAERLAPLVPPGLSLQRLGPGGSYAMFTHLTYRHGHFGPRLFGPLRRLWPSPIQSNWRLYVTDPYTGKAGVYFLTTAITSTPHALAARLLSEGVPMHVPQSAILRRLDEGSLLVSIDPGPGTSPDLAAELRPMPGEMLTGTMAECFESWKEMLAYVVPQDRALSVQPWYGRVVRQEIDLGISLDACRPLRGKVHSRAAKALVGDAEPVCFLVDHVAFAFFRQAYDPYRGPWNNSSGV